MSLPILTLEERKENNILIAKFIGKYRDHYSDVIRFTDGLFELTDTIHTIGCLDFHKRWDRLMVVIDKIESLSDAYYEVQTLDDKTSYLVQFDLSNTEKVGTNKIETFYLAAVDFINWYNSNKL